MKRPRIVVVGSLNMDLVVTADRAPQTGETLQGESVHFIPGGKGANQAVACARLGAEAHMIGAVGSDPFGTTIVDEMRKNGVLTDRIDVLKDTATGIASILHTHEDNSIVIVPGANGEVTPERVERSRDLIAQADVLLVQLEIPLEAAAAALRIARQAGVRTILNPAPARRLPEEMLRSADYITPNETEFAILGAYGDGEAADDMPPANWEMGLSEWTSRYGHAVILTRGKHGASYVKDGAAETIAAPPVQPVDTTGAGDCLNAAFAYGLASGWDTEHALRFAVRAASLSVTKFGAQDGMPTLAEVEGLPQ
ncbi:ribokinase [Cohnella cellulosilytica]|uniref:Ribokinase n=1 Tax=Cohnella cellulosilytica TaxID=986710 RepID=A0ABW2F9F2_9BACL